MSRTVEPIVSMEDAGVYPASPVQQRMFLADQVGTEGLASHIPIAIRFKDRVDPEVSRVTQAFRTIDLLEHTFQDLVSSHDVLRTSFTVNDSGQVVREVHEHLDTNVGLIQVDDVTDDSARAIMGLFVQPFDLGQAPLVRVVLVQGAGDESLLLFDGHRIVLDEMSMTMLIDEFFRLFQGDDVPPIRVPLPNPSS